MTSRTPSLIASAIALTMVAGTAFASPVGTTLITPKSAQAPAIHQAQFLRGEKRKERRENRDSNGSLRRDDRQDGRQGNRDGRQDDRQGCRDGAGKVGSDKRNCKQDERKDRVQPSDQT